MICEGSQGSLNLPESASMIGLPAGTRIWIAAGFTDMRCGFNGLAAKVEGALLGDPFSGHVFAFRGRRGNVIKLLWSSGLLRNKPQVPN
jgi:transposase